MNEDEIREMITLANERAMDDRIARLQFLLTIEGDRHLFLPALVWEYYEETRLCWYVGAFAPTIIMSQVVLEEYFRSHYRAAYGVGGELSTGKKVDRAGFYDLVQERFSDGDISIDEYNLLNKLRRRYRNPIVHVKDVKRRDIEDNSIEGVKKKSIQISFSLL